MKRAGAARDGRRMSSRKPGAARRLRGLFTSRGVLTPDRSRGGVEQGGFKAEVLSELSAVLGEDAVLHRPEDVIVYEYDYGLDRAMPDIVVFPSSTEQVAEIARIAYRHRLPLVARGAGTGIAGGAVPVAGGILVA